LLNEFSPGEWSLKQSSQQFPFFQNFISSRMCENMSLKCLEVEREVRKKCFLSRHSLLLAIKLIGNIPVDK